MRRRNVVMVMVPMIVAVTSLVQGHQYEWRLETSCPSCPIPPCEAHCSSGTCSWEVVGAWEIRTCESPPFCDLCSNATFPNDGTDDGRISDVGTKTIEFNTLTIDVLTIAAKGDSSDVSFGSLTSNNVLSVDTLILDATIDPDFVGHVTVTMTDGAKIINY